MTHRSGKESWKTMKCFGVSWNWKKKLYLKKLFHAMYIRHYWYWWNIDEGYIPFMISIPAIQVARSYRSNMMRSSVTIIPSRWYQTPPLDASNDKEIPYLPTKPWSGLYYVKIELNHLWNVDFFWGNRSATDPPNVNLSPTMGWWVWVKRWHCSIGRTFEPPAANSFKVAVTVRWHDNMRATTTDVSKSSGAV